LILTQVLTQIDRRKRRVFVEERNVCQERSSLLKNSLVPFLGPVRMPRAPFFGHFEPGSGSPIAPAVSFSTAPREQTSSLAYIVLAGVRLGCLLVGVIHSLLPDLVKQAVDLQQSADPNARLRHAERHPALLQVTDHLP
jgi:hypothetical protein